MEKKTIVVLGATGAQGGGLVRAILEETNGRFNVRAITRNARSPKALKLAKLGAQVVEANVLDLPSLVKAFEGAYGAFFVSFHWEHNSAEKEKQELKNLGLAAKHAGLQHIVYSSLEDTRLLIDMDDERYPTLEEHYKVPHFDVKGEAEQFFKALELPVTSLLTSFFWQNYITHAMGPWRNPAGRLVLSMPMSNKLLPGIDADDIGRSALAIFNLGKKYIGQRVGIAGGHQTGTDIASAFAEILQEPVSYEPMTHHDFRALGFPGASDLGNMFQFKVDFNEMYTKTRSIQFSRTLNPRLSSFHTWMQQHREQIIASVNRAKLVSQ